MHVAYSQWTQLPNLPVSGTVYDMYFVNASTGWITLISPFNLIKTTNGGQSWAVLASMNIRTIEFPDSLTGYGTGYVGTTGAIWKTINGGENWNSLEVTGNNYADISFVNKDTGWVCGDNGMPLQRIWRTTDGGSTFQVQYAGAGGSFQKIFMLKEKVNGEYWGWAYNGGLYRTTDSGLNWNLIYTGFGSQCGSVQDIVFIDTLNGAIARGNDCINRTYNGGYNWIIINEIGVRVGSRISAGSKDIAWITIASNDSIIKTTNFFLTYGKQIIPEFVSSIYALDTSVVFAGANQTNVIMTTNGGGNIVSVSNISSKHQIIFLYPELS